MGKSEQLEFIRIALVSAISPSADHMSSTSPLKEFLSSQAPLSWGVDHIPNVGANRAIIIQTDFSFPILTPATWHDDWSPSSLPKKLMFTKLKLLSVRVATLKT
jgi:hypothetical protein